MISAQIFWQSKRLVGFDIKGHADYAPHGEDIICAAVSVLAITAVNSLLEQVGPVMIKQSDDGLVSCRLPDESLTNEKEIKAQAILKTLLIGLNGVSMEYPEHVKLDNITS